MIWGRRACKRCVSLFPIREAKYWENQRFSGKLVLSLADKQGLGNVLARGTIIRAEHTTSGREDMQKQKLTKLILLLNVAINS